MENFSITDIAQYITAITIIFGVVGGFIAWLTSVYTKLSNIYKMLGIINSEFSANGGSSLRDAINAISDNQSKTLSITHTFHAYVDKTCDMPMLIADRSGRCSWANKAYLNLTNRNLNQVLDNLWESTVHIEDRDTVREEWYNACEDGRQFEISYRLNNNGTLQNYVKCNVYGDAHCGYVAFFEKIGSPENLALKKVAAVSITNSEHGKEKG